MPRKKRRKFWRHSEGVKGVNRITVYEREAGASLYLEWRDDLGRHQQVLKTVVGHPVTDKALAVELCKHLAEKQEQRRNASAAELIFGGKKPRSLGDLLERLHADKGAKWSEKHRKEQDRFRAFWTAKLGADAKLTRVPPALVERIVREAGELRKWSPRTRQARLRYIVDAFSYAQHKLKWITERHNLSAVEIPQPESRGASYTRDEVTRLLPALYRVDLRAAFVGEVANQSGRRLNAIRTLETSALKIVTHEGERVGVLTFPGETDKARRSGEVALYGRALAVAEELLTMPAVRKSGYFCPQGPLKKPGKQRAELTHARSFQRWLEDAEKIARIPHVKGRGFHGIKRRFATDTTDRRAASKQSGTNEDTLSKHYEQDDFAPKLRLVKNLEAKRAGA